MRSFTYQRPSDPSAAIQALAMAVASNDPPTEAAAQPLAGGTTLIDLMKLDVMRPATVVEITGKSGVRNIPFAQLHKPPGDIPQIETTLAPGELISAFTVSGRWPRSVYLKARDRQSYEFALSSAAVALDVQDGVVSDARVALGGLATVPWRAREAEALIT